jgi:hypothetical protein
VSFYLLFNVIIYLLSFDITKVRRLQKIEHGGFSLCGVQFSPDYFLGANPALEASGRKENRQSLSNTKSDFSSVEMTKNNKKSPIITIIGD